MKKNAIISTEIGSSARLVGEEKAVELVAKAGFNAWDFSMVSMCRYNQEQNSFFNNNHPLAGNNYLKFARRLKQIGLDNGIYCNQSHAPFPTDPLIIRPFLKRAIECTAEAGGKICVIHPMERCTPEENAQMYAELLPFAAQYGVKIATENMWEWDDNKNESCFAACATPKSFCAHVDALSSKWMVACLDIGHAEMRGSTTTAVDMIRALGPRLQALHIHDNDKWHDSHQLPFSMSICFEKIAAALKEIGYTGDFTLEANAYLNQYTQENIFEGIKHMAQSARTFAQMCQ